MKLEHVSSSPNVHEHNRLGYSLVVMVESTQNRNGDYLISTVIKRNRRGTKFRNLLLNPLMRSSPIEVCHIHVEYTLELLLMEDQHVIKAFLSHAPQKAFTDGIGAFRAIGRFEKLDAARCRHTSETGAKLAIVITDQILWGLPIRCGFAERYARPRDRWEIVSLPRGSLAAT